VARDRKSKGRPGGSSGKSANGNRGANGRGAAKGDKPPGQVGRRPSRPGFLLAVGFLWIAVAVIELFALDASWRFVPAIVFAGIGLFFLRGAAVTVTRRDGGSTST